MTALHDTMDAVWRTVRDARRRRIGYAVLALVMMLFAVFPQPHLARARILPRDPSAALGMALGNGGSRFQDVSALLGGGSRAIDLYLAIAQSTDIRTEVIAGLHLAGPGRRFATVDDASLHLAQQVDVQSLPGGILQVETKTRDADLALQLTQAYTETIARHLRALNSEQVGVKQTLLETRFRDAATRLTQAQSALNAFRTEHRISAAPEAELGNAIAVKSGIEAKLQAKLVEVKTLQQMLGPDNVRLRSAKLEVQGLREQLAQATSPASSAGGPNAGGLTKLSTQYFDLYRDYLFAQSIYDAYTRLSEQVAIEDLSDRNAPTVQFIETPHVEPGIHVNVGVVAALVLLIVVALFTEFYAPATGIELWGLNAPDDRRTMGQS